MEQINSLETPDDLGRSPEAIARRWKLELKLADKREANWRKKVKEIYETYSPENPLANSFNILWANTETLRHAVYNSLPQPQVRRRYQDEDELGKNVSTVMIRALEFSQDTYDFDGGLKGDVLAMLLAGRAVSRIKYVPQITEATETREDEAQESDADSESYEEIGWEQVICSRVQYDDFRILCAAKTWDDVTALSFRHRMTREDLVDKFGDEIGNKISLDTVDDEDIKKSKDVEDLFKTAEVLEIWDKEGKEVIWITQSYPVPCLIQDDPLRLQGFFPVPKPLYAIENDQDLVPQPIYSQYEQQAKELNRITKRINVLVEACKVRGIYDAMLSELSELMKGVDNDLIAAQNATALIERGGLEKAIWFMPIEQTAKVLQILYEQREKTKQVIYELTGISDIMRAASDPNETFGAQKIKTQWGTQRLQRMQQEVQRYIRDLIRLKAEIIAEKFQPETLQAMTLVDLPHQAQVDQQNQQMIMQYKQQAQTAMMQGQQPPPQPQLPNPMTWEKVIEAMRNDATRTYHIDIETDSTLSATQDSDMSGLREVLTAVSQAMQAFAPAVQAGALPVEAVKEILLVIVRRARMGSAVEDALEKIQPPKPPQDPEAGKMQAQMQIEQAKQQAAQQQMQMEFQLDQQRAQLDAQVEQAKQRAQAEQNAHQNSLEAQRMQLQMQNDAALEQMRIAADERSNHMQSQIDMLIAQMNNAAKIEVAEIAANTSLQASQINAARAGSQEN